MLKRWLQKLFDDSRYSKSIGIAREDFIEHTMKLDGPRLIECARRDHPNMAEWYVETYVRSELERTFYRAFNATERAGWRHV